MRAEARGTRLYSLELILDQDGARGACNCPAFHSFGPCKHLWALILELDTLPGGWPEGTAAGRLPWQVRLQAIADARSVMVAGPQATLTNATRIEYHLLPGGAHGTAGLGLEIRQRRRLRGGHWGAARHLTSFSPDRLRTVPAEDRPILAILLGSHEPYGDLVEPWLSHRRQLGPELASVVLPRLAATGRCFLAMADTAGGDWDEPGPPLEWDDGLPWQARLHLDPDPAGDLLLTLRRHREEEDLEFGEDDLLLGSSFLVTRGRLSRLEAGAAAPWVEELAHHGPLAVPAADAGTLVEELLPLAGGPRLAGAALPPVDRVEPCPVLLVDAPDHGRKRTPGTRLPCRLHFLYGEHRLPAGSPRPGLLLERAAGETRIVPRDPAAEERAHAAFAAAGGRLLASPRTSPLRTEEGDWILGTVAAGQLDALALELLAQGWLVEAEGRELRSAGAVSVSVRSGVDWFDLEGQADFGGQPAGLPELLEAVRQGRRRIRLGDGSVGILPEEWLRRWGLLATLGKPAAGAAVRLPENQAWVVDAIAAEGQDVDADAAFAELRGRLRRAATPVARREPRAFRGALRPYQRVGLGWLRFLEELGLGGCLADDMGLGKTVQVLAHLQARRSGRRRQGPSLVVAPRSLVHNWLQEAARFTPRLRCLDYSGPGREDRRGDIARQDVVFTTYGILRRDVAPLRETVFDLVVLDEAQAIKNPASQSARAARALRARHRLALSGTPVENHLGELWSLFEFLNPGMLGRARVFQELAGGRNGATLSDEARERLASALRPFFLRRTKGQVLPELPPRVEATLECDLAGRQRRDYEALRRHYKQELLGTRGAPGRGMQVLEALLRLRQAACHPGLLDPSRRDEPSAKLEALLEHLREVRESGHKALVFSQFTSFLDIVRRRLEGEKLPCTSLDGRVRKREERIRRFQEDPDCSFFLVSLKAGGTGLNLTAADYVFLLDPWWNPAVERQAVDRSHRIGQTRTVFAYRLLCRETVEEKILALQQRKRALADALFGAGGSLLRELTREDLELLLS